VEKFVENEEFTTQTWVEAAEGQGMLTVYRDHHLQAQMHKDLREGTADVAIMKLLGRRS